MRCDIGNMLRQAGRAAGNRYGYEYCLQTLAQHLQQLRDRTLAGDMAALNEFFTFYVFDDGKDYADTSSTSGTAPAQVSGTAEAGPLMPDLAEAIKSGVPLVKQLDRSTLETGESPEAQQQRNSEWDRQREQIAAGLSKNRPAE